MTVGGVVSGVGATVTVADFVMLPPAPLHNKVYVYVFIVKSAPVDCDPESDFAPLQSPDAVQVVALVELHVRVAEPPGVKPVGAAVSVNVGGVPTVTVAEAEPVPPGPVHDSV